MTGHAIETYGLSKAFSDTIAVDRVSFTVPRGNIFGFLGPNGAGKTTTIRLLLDLIRPTDGYATVLGFDTRRQGDHIRRSIGVLLEDDALYSRLSIYENLRFHGEINRIPQPKLDQKIETALRGIRLWNRRNEKTFRLSKGLRRKVALVRALLHDPQLLFLDEPTAGLDPASIASIRENITRLSSSGITIFLATHNLSEAERICHQIGIIHHGRLLQSGPTNELLLSMRHPSVDIRCTSVNDETCRRVASVDGITSCTFHNGVIRVTMSDSRLISSVIRLLVESDVSVESVVPQSGNLEDLYLSMVEEQRNDE